MLWTSVIAAEAAAVKPRCTKSDRIVIAAAMAIIIFWLEFLGYLIPVIVRNELSDHAVWFARNRDKQTQQGHMYCICAVFYSRYKGHCMNDHMVMVIAQLNIYMSVGHAARECLVVLSRPWCGYVLVIPNSIWRHYGHLPYVFQW